jgi:hypothetical protein
MLKHIKEIVFYIFNNAFNNVSNNSSFACDALLTWKTGLSCRGNPQKMRDGWNY